VKGVQAALLGGAPAGLAVDGDYVGGYPGQGGNPTDEASLKLLGIQRGEHFAQTVMIGRGIRKGPEAPQKIELVFAELRDGGEGLGPGEDRKQGQQQDLVQRINHLAELPRVRQIRKMIQKNDALQYRFFAHHHHRNLPIESIGDSQIQPCTKCHAPTHPIALASPANAVDWQKRACSVGSRMPQSNPLVLKYEKRDRLSDEEREVLERSVSETRQVGPDRDLVREGSRPAESTLLLDGLAARYRDLSSGKRQITALHVTGDFVDLHSFLLHKMDHGVTTLTACKVALVPHERLREITEKYPHLTRILWLSTLIDAAIHREWLVSMGRRSSVAHLAHLLCELHLRLQQVAQTTDTGFRFPVTQAELGDVLGLSVVHINRSLQELRASGAVAWRGDLVTINDWDRLQEIAEFDPTYLNLQQEPR
jgi:CRP-like cAMP-binding protein